MFPKLFTALVTPFKESSVDYDAFEAHLERQVQSKITGLLVLGTTAESPTLSSDEKKNLIALATKHKSYVMVGAGSNCTKTTLENIHLMEQMGAHSALIITPYYNRPSQRGIIEHFRALCDHSSLPIFLYNHPKRTGTHIQLDTLKTLMEIPQIVGIKDASGNLDYIQNIVAFKKTYRKDFLIYSGDDSNLIPYMTLGSDGLISVASNLIPKTLLKWISHLENKDLDEAQAFNQSLKPFLEAMNLEINPVGIKAAMNLCNFCSDSVRLPLTNMQKEHKQTLKQSIENNPLIYGETQQKHHKATV